MAEVTQVDGKKAIKCKREFRLQNGDVVGRANAEVASVVFTFPENNHVFEMSLSDLPEGVLRAAAAFGINTSVGNTFGAIVDVDEAIEAAEARWETLKTGSWASERQVGPRTSDLLEAIVAVRAAAGRPTDDAWRDAAKAKIESGEWTAKTLLSDANVKASFDAIKAKRAAERAAKSAENAKSASPTIEGLLD